MNNIQDIKLNNISKIYDLNTSLTQILMPNFLVKNIMIFTHLKI